MTSMDHKGHDGPRSRSLTIVGGYFGISALWIAFSDRLVGRLSSDTEQLVTMSTAKGWLFVGVTTLLLYGALRRRDQSIARRQESLRAAAEELQAIYDGANEAIIVRETDDSARIVSCNQTACEMYGYERERLMACRPGDLCEGVAPYDGEHALRWLRLALEQGPQVFEWRARRADGTCFWAEVSMRSSEIAGHRRVVEAVRDIGNRKQAEEAVRRREEHFMTLFRTVPVPTIITRRSDGVCIETNDAFSEQTGFSREDLLGRNMRTAPFSPWVDPERQRQVLQEMETKGYVRGLEAQFRRKDGSVFPGLISMGAITVGSDECLVTSVLDVSAQRTVEEMLRRSERLESLGVLAGGIAHDFNNLLAGVFGHLDVARESLRAQEPLAALESLDAAFSVFGRARALTQQLLTFAKGGAPMRKSQSVVELVRKAVAFATSGSNCEVSFDAGPDVWLCDVDGEKNGTGDRQSGHQRQAGHAAGGPA